LYIIEDIYPGSKLNEDTSIIRETVGKNKFFFVGLKNNQCVIQKKTINAIGFC
jgi:hypothetical protein